MNLSEDDSVPFQLNVATDQRNAGRDYNEHHYHTDPGAFLEMASVDELDRKAINNEIFFRRRFGFTLPVEQRKQLIALKQLWDFTDRELMQLKRAGLLRLRKGQPASLRAPRTLFAYGCFIIGVSAFYCLLCLILILVVKMHLTWHQQVTQVAVLITSIAFLALGDSCSFGPLRILRQRGFKLGQKFILPL